MAHYRLFYARIFWIFFRSTFCEHFSPDWRPRGFQWLAEFPLKLYKFREHLSNFTLLSVLHYESFDDWKISIMLYQHLKPWNEKVKVNFLIFMCINSTIFFQLHIMLLGKKINQVNLKWVWPSYHASCDAKCQGARNEYVVKLYSPSPAF